MSSNVVWSDIPGQYSKEEHMGFESVRGYVELASGLGDLTKARAKDAALGLLSLPVAGITTGGKVASQASSLADELLAAATANRSNLTMLVRSEVDVAITRLGLVSVRQLEEARSEAATLRAEVARLRSASSRAAAPRSTSKTAPRKAVASNSPAKKAVVSKSATKKAAASRSATKKATAKTAKTAAKTGSTSRSAVSTRAKPAGR
ncbi:MAG: hypothetical protein QOE58_3117 [Actinomycetota bacterium]|jgi:hypothetical protein|nr:hypothetical protein [Actinomycetota bacterium]